MSDNYKKVLSDSTLEKVQNLPININYSLTTIDPEESSEDDRTQRDNIHEPTFSKRSLKQTKSLIPNHLLGIDNLIENPVDFED